MNEYIASPIDIDPNTQFHDGVISLKKHNDFLLALLEFTSSLIESTTIEQVLDQLVNHTIESMNFEDCVIYLVDPDGESLYQKAAYGPKNDRKHGVKNPIKLRIGEGVVGHAAENLEYVLVNDTREDKRYVVDDEARLSELAMPIVYHDKLLGVLDSGHSCAHFFKPYHIKMMRAIVSVLATKIVNCTTISRLETTIEELEYSRKLQESLYKISALAHTSNNLNNFYAQLHQELIPLLNTQNFFICLQDKLSGEIRFPYLYDENNGSSFILESNQAGLKKSLIARVLETQQPLQLDKKQLIALQKQGKGLTYGGIPSFWLAIPFEVNESHCGAVAVQSMRPGAKLTLRERRLLEYVAQHLSEAIRYRKQQKQLHFQALHDGLTGLPNRSLFEDRVNHALGIISRKDKQKIAVLFLDLDNFKTVNDSYGHHVGDRLLKIIAQTIQIELRDADTLSRLGGDEFTILLEDLSQDDIAVTITKRIIKKLAEPILINDIPISISVSIGISLSTAETLDAKAMIKQADLAMYQSKNAGKNTYFVFDEDLNATHNNFRKIRHELGVALEKKQLILYYQLVMDIQNHQPVGFEALLRWQHPDKGLLTPASFIQVVEESDIILQIDSYILEMAVKQLIEWRREFTKPLYVSVNISGRQFSHKSFYHEVKRIIQLYQLPKNSLCLEVTERILIDNIAKAIVLLKKLKRLGVRILLDDFGTGYSSLSYLHQLPFDVLKIDKSFVQDMGDKLSESSIVNSIMTLAHSLNMQVIAEGIENKIQLDLLKNIDCPFGQGYYLSYPLEMSKTYSLLKQFN